MRKTDLTAAPGSIAPIHVLLYEKHFTACRVHARFGRKGLRLQRVDVDPRGQSPGIEFNFLLTGIQLFVVYGPGHLVIHGIDY